MPLKSDVSGTPAALASLRIRNPVSEDWSMVAMLNQTILPLPSVPPMGWEFSGVGHSPIVLTNLMSRMGE